MITESNLKTLLICMTIPTIFTWINWNRENNLMNIWHREQELYGFCRLHDLYVPCLNLKTGSRRQESSLVRLHVLPNPLIVFVFVLVLKRGSFYCLPKAAGATGTNHECFLFSSRKIIRVSSVTVLCLLAKE